MKSIQAPSNSTGVRGTIKTNPGLVKNLMAQISIKNSRPYSHMKMSQNVQGSHSGSITQKIIQEMNDV